MTETFICSDHHFSHSNIWAKFTKSDGSPLREFSSNEEMNETIIKQHNSVVGIKDTVYMLGDVTLHSNDFSIVSRLNGIKILILGNHDDPQHINEYAKYFKSVHGILGDKKNQLVLSHVPPHPASLGRWGKCCHGHLHSHRVQIVINDKSYDDCRYLNCSLEQLDQYKPWNIDQVNQQFKQMREQLDSWPFDEEKVDY